MFVADHVAVRTWIRPRSCTPKSAALGDGLRKESGILTTYGSCKFGNSVLEPFADSRRITEINSVIEEMEKGGEAERRLGAGKFRQPVTVGDLEL